MTLQSYQELTITKLIQHASSALWLNISELKKRFRNFPICLMDYIENDSKENLVEIRFDDEKATLSCMLNKDSKSNNIFLFFDDSDCLNEYINYLNTVYTYDYRECRWLLPDCYLSLKKAEYDMCMYFYYEG